MTDEELLERALDLKGEHDIPLGAAITLVCATEINASLRSLFLLTNDLLEQLIHIRTNTQRRRGWFS